MHRDRLPTWVSIVAAVMASLFVTLDAPQVDAAPRAKASVEVADVGALAPNGQSVTIEVGAQSIRR